MIRLEHVAKSFNGNPVLRDVTFDINDGESVVLIGRSGQGKSVALRNILGLIKPDRGKVWVDGEDVTQMSPEELREMRKKVGMLFQNAALWDSMNVFDNIALALRHHTNMTENEIEDVVYSSLMQVGLHDPERSGQSAEDVARKMPSDLSGGMRKRVGLARALATHPGYMLYDEPTTGLDPIMAGIIDNLIRELNTLNKTTSLTITHDMRSAFTIADRVVVLHHGEIIFD
ncbi:MAG: ATP-binding cassette domain-containing protein, partial [bacterium]